jgi:hypothetical protein
MVSVAICIDTGTRSSSSFLRCAIGLGGKGYVGCTFSHSGCSFLRFYHTDLVSSGAKRKNSGLLIGISSGGRLKFSKSVAAFASFHFSLNLLSLYNLFSFFHKRSLSLSI